jgi:hypothetical protein
MLCDFSRDLIEGQAIDPGQKNACNPASPSVLGARPGL